MAKISRVDFSRTRDLLPEMLIGRSSLCGLRLEGADVSKEHAVIRWTGSAWELRDLNSRNGTFVAGRRLTGEDRVVLEAGMELCFGSEERWRLDELSGPLLCARTIDEGEVLVRSGQQLLAFGSEEDFLASVYRDARDRWVLERDGEVEPVHSGELEIGGRRWLLELPDPIDATAEPSSRAFVRRAKMRFTTSGDAPLGLTIDCGDEHVDLKRRGHHQLTLALAKRRLEDRARGVIDSEQGWVGYRELQALLSCTRNLVNVNVHRARKQLEEAGFADAAGIVERRLSSGELRIGVSSLEIIVQPGEDVL